MSQYIMNYTQREQAVKDFKAVLPHLWNGLGNEYASGKEQFICVALLRLDGDTLGARELVRRSLDGYGTYEDWLESRGYKVFEWSERRIQNERKRWVRAIIKALQDSLK